MQPLTTLAQEPDLSVFGQDPFWLILLKGVFCLAFVLLTVLICIVMERKVLGWMQLRIGPNRHGPWGLLQSLADGVKLMLKEDITVKGADKPVYILAPALATIPALMAVAVIPFGPKDDPVSIFGTETVLQATDLPVALLYVLATSAIAVYGTVLAGWSSNSTYPLLGGVRATAQIISYEVAMGLSFAAVFLYSGSMSTSAIVDAQEDRWFVILLPVSFLIYMVTMVGEAHRPPFDMPESEGDLVGGYLTEYSSIKFAFFMMSEYIHTVTVSMLMVTVFLGGWRAPAPLSFWEGANSGWWPLLWFTIKMVAVIFFFVWIRGALPRVRYDQLMVLGWKVLIPIALVWLMLVAVVRAMQNEDYAFRDIVLYVSGGVLVLLLLSFVVDIFRDRAERRAEEAAAAAPEPEFDPMAGGFPVPPLPGQKLPPVPRRPSRAERAKAGAGAGQGGQQATAAPTEPKEEGDDA
ncbi:NADH-quinone oxidoreductase subunit NuoH [Streptomyces sp. 7-21]|jgi:NADH-quinone oxidoreductase subunit H|uniref:NADH-quinone oxidoreductase subunit NuoH n=1 Tax=Streptomyces sp. 7-21 TaxID=2802283 RepID=UPI00191F4940|nr:NADH-quinone oxidoreductase subunit NuoH [Streptomyces sp. 7-21]MBL1065497.1 NADH-quinone oxidoreductase subunit NuoH [Streptomyces sp. 7-21]